MEQPMKKHGASTEEKRPRGRPPIDKENGVGQIKVLLTPLQQQTYKMLGAADWLRAELDALAADQARDWTEKQVNCPR